jgi:RimJ/RimL family protein N-acetyltransferase
MIELQPFERSDFQRLISWVPSAEFLMQWAGFIFKYPLDEAQLEEYLRSAEKNPARRCIWKAVNSDTGEVIGHVELNNIYEHDRKADLCRVMVAPSHRGKGYGKQMVLKVLEFAFAELGLHRVQLGVYNFNESAIRCYETCGFVKEGLLRECRRMGKEWWSLYQMSILEHEWRTRQKKLLRNIYK